MQGFKRPRLYQQLAEHLSDFIEVQGLVPGDKLPPERDLAAQLGVSRATLSQALVALEVQGKVDIRHGDGVVVQDSKERSRHAVTSLQAGLVRSATLRQGLPHVSGLSGAAAWTAICTRADEPATAELLDQLQAEPPSLSVETWARLGSLVDDGDEAAAVSLLWAAELDNLPA